MATVAIVLKTTKKLLNNEYAIALRVTHERISRYYTISSLVTDQSLKFRCSASDWRPAKAEDNGLGRFLKTVKPYKELNAILEAKLILARKFINECENDGISFDYDEFEKKLRGNSTRQVKISSKLRLHEFYDSLIQELDEQKRIGLSTIFQDSKSMLLKFRPDAFLTDVTVKFLEAFESWLRHERGNKDTTISVKMRNIQRVINIAIAEKLFKSEDYPFGEKKYSVNRRLNHKTRKRSIPIDLIAKIKNLTLEDGSSLLLARDIFMFSFYTRGMNFIDIAGLKWSDIEENEIRYVRKKTGQLFDIPINEHTQSILKYYKIHHSNSGNYIFPIYDESIHKTEKQRYTRKKTAIKKINDKLKDIAEMIGEKGLKLTTYVSRHSYATNMKHSGVATSYISEALGHQTEEQTQTYLGDFEKGIISGLENKIFDF